MSTTTTSEQIQAGGYNLDPVHSTVLADLVHVLAGGAGAEERQA
jgi:hypothetical protein